MLRVFTFLGTLSIFFNMRFLITIGLLFFIMSGSFSQTWERIYGLENRNDRFNCLVETYDQGYLIGGIYHYFPDTRGWIIKTDINGNLLYEITLGIESGLQQCNWVEYIESTQDGGTIICGNFDGFGTNDVSVTKLDACGELEWCKIFKTDYWPDFACVIHQLPDEGYIMLTQGYAMVSPLERVHLFRFDMSGNLLWIQQYLGDEPHPQIENEFMQDMIVTASGDYFMSGYCYWRDSLPPGISRLKTITILADSNRQEEFVSIYKRDSINAYSSAFHCTQKDNANFYTGVCYRFVETGEFPSMLLVQDSLGNILLDTMPQIPDIGDKWAEGFLENPMFTSDGRLFTHSIMCDSTNFYPAWFSLHELDSMGGWINTFLHPEAHYEARTIMTSDEKIVAGAVIGYNYAQDIILMKFNTSLQYDSIYTQTRQYDYLCPDTIVSHTIDLSECQVIVDVKDVPSKDEYEQSIRQIPIIPYPNPARNEIRFTLKNTEHHKNIVIQFYDILGRKVQSERINSGNTELKLDISDWPQGIYLAVVNSGNKSVGKSKFIIQ